MNIEELREFIKLHPDNYSIQIKRHFPLLYNKIDEQYSFSKFCQKLYHFIYGDESGKCKICKSQCKFDGLHKGYRDFCSRKCRSKQYSINVHETRTCVICNSNFEIYKKRKKTTCSQKCLFKLNASPEVINKRLNSMKKTMLEKYGVEHSSKMVGFASKVKKTKLERYGNENYVNAEKNRKTKLERYGDENYINVLKAKETNLKKL